VFCGVYEGRAVVSSDWDASSICYKVDADCFVGPREKRGGFCNLNLPGTPLGLAPPGVLSAAGIVDHLVFVDEVNAHHCVFM